MKKSFQSSFSIRFAILIVIEALLIAGLFFYLSSGTLTTSYEGSQIRIEKTPSFFFMTFMMISLIAALAIAISGMILFIVLSHRIAGPIHRLELALREINRGDLTHRIQLRKKDEFTDLADGINQLTERLDRQFLEIKREAEKASATKIKAIADSFKTSP